MIKKENWQGTTKISPGIQDLKQLKKNKKKQKRL